MCFLKRRKKELEYIERINSIIEGTDYQIAVFKIYYKAFGNVLLKLVAKGNKNIKIVTDRGDIFLNTKPIFSDEKIKASKDVIEKVFEILTLVINIIKTDDWRLTGQEDYLLFAKLKEIIPSDYLKTLDNPEYFHEHCEFCMTKPEDNKEQKFYCTLDNYCWICEECYNDFKEKFKFEKL